jgi:hypothetical protein
MSPIERLQWFRSIVDEVRFPGYRFVVEMRAGPDPTLLLFARFDGKCPVTGEYKQWTTRKWVLSEHACRSEVVQTCLKLVLTSVEHEARESFTYQGRRLFGPHTSMLMRSSMSQTRSTLARRSQHEFRGTGIR